MLSAVPEMDIENERYAVWQDLFEKRCGVKLTQDREVVLTTLIANRIRQLGLEDEERYLGWLLSGSEGYKEWHLLLDEMLIKETIFFRHQQSLSFAARRMVELHHRGLLDKPFWVWSVGCSTGEEAYSLAIALEQACQLLGIAPNYGVIGSDISRSAVKRASEGRYSSSRLGKLSAQQIRQFFVQQPEGDYQVADPIRDRVRFVHSNIVDTALPHFSKSVHLIYCQNVLIYFRRWMRKRIVQQMVGNLGPNGCLVLGLGEISGFVPQGYRRHDSKTVQAYVPAEDV